MLHDGHFQIPTGMVVRGGRRQSIRQPALHMSELQRKMLPTCCHVAFLA